MILYSMDNKYFYIALSVLFFLYFYNFHNGLSLDSNDWGNFGSYIGGLGSLVLSIMLFIHTKKIDKKHTEHENLVRKNNLLNHYNDFLSMYKRWYNIENTIETSTIYERGKDEYNDKKKERDELTSQLISKYTIVKYLSAQFNIELCPVNNNDINKMKIEISKGLKELTN